MAKLDLEWLAVFDEIYKTGSVSKAAERLDMAQAAASTMLNKLRAHFDDRLFARTAQGMQPTPYAQRIYPHVREVLAQLEQARGSRSSFDPGQARRNFRICMTDISEVVLLPGAARPPAPRGAGRAHRDRDHLDRQRPPAGGRRGRPGGGLHAAAGRGLLPADALQAELRLPGGAEPSAHRRAADARSASRPRRMR